MELLLPYQLRWVTDAARFKIGVWSRQTGKSFSTAAECVTNCLMNPGTTWVCMSAGERQSLEWLDKAKIWAGGWKAVLDAESETRDSAEALLKAAEIRFSNGSRIIALPGNASTARGYSANVVLDEFAWHDNPDAIWAAMYPSQSNPLTGTFPARLDALLKGQVFTGIQRELKLRIVSTFNGRDNKFYSLWERREENGYSGHFIDIHTAIKEGSLLNVEKLRAGLDDPEIWAQEYECVPADVSAVLLPYDLLATCESAEASVSIGADFFESRKPYVIGIDFGRKRDLTVAWTDELVGDVSHCREVLELRAMPTPDQVALLRPRIRNARRVCFDYSPPGIGLGDFLVKEFGEYNPQKHLFGKIELCTFTNPLKLELFSKLRMAFELSPLPDTGESGGAGGPAFGATGDEQQWDGDVSGAAHGGWSCGPLHGQGAGAAGGGAGDGDGRVPDFLYSGIFHPTVSPEAEIKEVMVSNVTPTIERYPILADLGMKHTGGTPVPLILGDPILVHLGSGPNWSEMDLNGLKGSKMDQNNIFNFLWDGGSTAKNAKERKEEKFLTTDEHGWTRVGDCENEPLIGALRGRGSTGARSHIRQELLIHLRFNVVIFSYSV